MIDWWIFTMTVFLLLFLIIIIWSYQLSKPFDKPKDEIELNKIENELETGDLIAVSYQSIRGNLVKCFTGSSWTHLGMIYKDCNTGEVFVLEVSYYTNKEQGIIKRPLRYWLDWNEDRDIVYIKHIGTPISSNDIDRILTKMPNVSPDTNVVNWLKTLVKRPYYPRNLNKPYYCSEFIIILLQELNVIEKEYLADGYQPWEAIFGKLKYINGHSYDRPLLLNL